MSDGGVERLVRYCRDEVGPNVRIVATYTERGARPVYVRDDLREAYEPERFEDLLTAAWELHPTLHRLQETDGPSGRHNAAVHTFEHAVVFQFAHEPERGCVVSFDREVGRNLSGFIDRCAARLG